MYIYIYIHTHTHHLDPDKQSGWSCSPPQNVNKSSFIYNACMYAYMYTYVCMYLCVCGYLRMYACMYNPLYTHSSRAQTHKNQHQQAKIILRANGEAPFPNTISQYIVEYIGQMLCIEEGGEELLVKNRNTSANSLKGGGSTLQKDAQSGLMNEYFLLVWMCV